MGEVQEAGESGDRESSDRVAPMPQEKWRHYKGQVCTIAHVTTALRSSKELEKAYITSISWSAKSAGDINAGDTVVLYWHDATEIWARSLQDFLAVLGDKDQADGGTMFYRFERVGE